MNWSAKDGARSSPHYGGEGVSIHPSHQGVCRRHGTEEPHVTPGGLARSSAGTEVSRPISLTAKWKAMGIPPIRSSPWRWPITPSRRAGGPATTASRSDGGAGAPAELALRTGALSRRSWLPTHRRPFAAAHSPCLSRPPERMWTNAVCPRLPPRRDPAHDPARNRLDRHPR